MEVLVSILVLSIGMLGVMGLQMASLRSLNHSRLQATAGRLGADMAEIMQGNLAVALSSSGNPYLIDTEQGPPTGSATCLMSGCSDARQQAQGEVAEWLARLQGPQGLPQVRAVICRDTAPYDAAGLPRWACLDQGDTVVIKIGWPGSNGSDSATQPPSRPGLIVRAVGGAPW